MAISYTYHGQSLAIDRRGGLAPATVAPALNKPSAVRQDVADGAVSSALAAGWYRIVALTTSYVLISSTATNGVDGMHMPAGDKDVIWIEAGDKIGCSAGA